MQLCLTGGHLLFIWKTCYRLIFHFEQIDWSEICTKVSFTSPELMWMLIMRLSDTEVKFYPEVRSQTSLSSLWVPCKRALSFISKQGFIQAILMSVIEHKELNLAIEFWNVILLYIFFSLLACLFLFLLNY